MFRLEARPQQSRAMMLATPVLAVIATMIGGAILFVLLGKDPVEAIRIIFIDPFFDPFSRSELLVKGAPLVLIAIGLSFGFRAGIWNIGAEGQFIMGAIAGSAVGLAFYGTAGLWLLPLMALAGMLGGAAYAMVPAILKVRFNANEILVSLMLVYVADQFLRAIVSGPLRNPQGFNFPESRLFHDSAVLPILFDGTRVHVGVLAALVAVIVAWFVMERHVIGYNVKLLGAAPRAAGFAGVKQKRLTVLCLAISGGLAGLAGMIEAAGPFGQLVPTLPQGYGFTAIIVAFLGRLNPFGILLAGLVMALTYIGGETAQFRLQLPAAAISTFQGMLLFFLLGFDLFVKYRVRWARKGVA
ncbi:simple sugar transport system permease protein [Rubricella aquisinus]|uniref:Simple sugar transport system permease protein n=1 Tax=Rubricella aquisinus TaxID=2028108 RepID=A0A840WZJ6_9RHOB|nr:ABC transporter permease [Rubricella aquisinus]MBB5515076.1 simple sugar transport system permease protein [Rubricella aquisinus]